MDCESWTPSFKWKNEKQKNVQEEDLPDALAVRLKSDERDAELSEAAGWRLTFSEDFDSAENFTNHWTKSNHTINNAFDDDQTYFAENAFVRDGSLIIETRQKATTIAGRTTNFTSAWVTTEDWFSQRYGRFAFRARLPNGSAPGIFPALWMMPTRQPCWPTAGEIDVMEVRKQLCESAFDASIKSSFLDRLRTNIGETQKKLFSRSTFRTLAAWWVARSPAPCTGERSAARVWVMARTGTGDSPAPTSQTLSTFSV
eukprot:COSAG06_NODE_16263_length_1010_cov_1.125137_1_plen_257_part_00